MTELGGKGTDRRTDTFSRDDLVCSYSCVRGNCSYYSSLTLSVLAC